MSVVGAWWNLVGKCDSSLPPRSSQSQMGDVEKKEMEAFQGNAMWWLNEVIRTAGISISDFFLKGSRVVYCAFGSGMIGFCPRYSLSTDPPFLAESCSPTPRNPEPYYGTLKPYYFLQQTILILRWGWIRADPADLPLSWFFCFAPGFEWRNMSRLVID